MVYHLQVMLSLIVVINKCTIDTMMSLDLCLNGDIAGLCARTDSIDDPFFSFTGYNRGQIRGVYKTCFQSKSNTKR